MNRGNIVSQVEVAAPGLLLYEEEVWRDEAESSSDSRLNQNLPGVDITTVVDLKFEQKKYKIHKNTSFKEVIYIEW